MAVSAVATTGEAAPVRPCHSGTPEHQEAAKQLAEIDAAIRRLAPAEDPSALGERLQELGQTRCFAILGGLGVDAQSGLALRTWWEDGGHIHAASGLQLAGSHPIVWIEPDVRRTLAVETTPGHRLAPLLCRAYDAQCGRETDGWRLRAEAAFERGARIRRLQGDGSSPFGWTEERPPSRNDCAAFARKAPPRSRLNRFRDCLAAAAERALTFPIGRLRKPTQGWLVVSGRRGHYGFCDELRAFDLGIGAAYRVASCGALALVSDGSVDHRATDAGRRIESGRGTVSLEEIREAAWMLLLLGELEESVRGFGQALPEGILIVLDEIEDAEGGGRISGSITGSTGNTLLAWRVAMAGSDLGSGTLTWPRDLNDDAEAHAAELLEVAEASFVPGCPSARPPHGLEKQLQQLSANHRDADSTSLRKAASGLEQAWQKLITASCGGP